MVLISLYIKRRNKHDKGGALIFKYPNERALFESGAYSRTALIRVAAPHRSFKVLVVKSGFTWTLTKVFPGFEYWRVAGYNGKMSVKILTFKFLSLKTLRKKKKVFHYQKQKVCNQGSNPGSSMVPSPLHYHANTTEFWKNLIIQIQLSIFL